MNKSIPPIDSNGNEDFDRFKELVKPLINLDLKLYKPKQMERRILNFMNSFKIASLHEFYESLSNDNMLLQAFINMLTINVSEFFRDQERFKELETFYFPEQSEIYKGHLRIWSAGCSTGAEIYSIAMILDKLNILSSSYLLATDIDEIILEKAKSGIFNHSEIESLNPEYLKYFECLDDNSYKISSKIINSINFVNHDLLKDDFDRAFNLIVCRNVVIYFTDEAKTYLYKKFYNSLNEDGIFFVGSTERILNYRELGFKVRSSFFYQKNKLT
ncbi:MAG: protein-glutamate O-methyltransferase CheR [Cyanobacteriota bacterium]